MTPDTILFILGVSLGFILGYFVRDLLNSLSDNK